MKKTMIKIKHLVLPLVFFLSVTTAIKAITPPHQAEGPGSKSTVKKDCKQVNDYVKIGLENNLALQQRELSLARSLQALREAKGMFLPSVSIEARYSKAGGGRVIEMPIGDLVNPIHQTLNQLLTAHGMLPGYPANITNERIPFLRKTEQDTKLRIQQPLFQPAIYYNFKIKKNLTAIEKAKVNAFKRQLTEDIKTAYFNYRKTLEVKKLLADTKELLDENLKLNLSLFNNHKQTEEVVFRARAELSQLARQQGEADKNVHLAASYFNFLLNRPLDAKIDVPEKQYTNQAANQPAAQPNLELPHSGGPNLETMTTRALAHRNEFKQLQSAIAAANHTVKLHRSSLLPTVTAVLDYGFQGEKYSFTGKDDYWMGSVVLSWNLYKGGQDAAKRKQALYDKKRLETQLMELDNQIRLQVKEAYFDLDVAAKTVVSTGDTLKSREEAFRIIAKKYQQGMVPQIEYVKARNDFTSAGISSIIAIYDFYIKKARLERVSAGYHFEGEG